MIKAYAWATGLCALILAWLMLVGHFFEGNLGPALVVGLLGSAMLTYLVGPLVYWAVLDAERKREE